MSKLSIFVFFFLSLISNFLQKEINETTFDEDFQKKFKLKRIRNGTGRQYPKHGELVSCHIKGTMEDGTVLFDSRKDGTGRIEFDVGLGQVLPCWDEVVIRMTLSEIVEVVCPYNLAFGDKGVGAIPPKANVKFRIELLKIGVNMNDL